MAANEICVRVEICVIKSTQIQQIIMCNYMIARPDPDRRDACRCAALMLNQPITLNLTDFHFQTLSENDFPLQYLASPICLLALGELSLFVR